MDFAIEPLSVDDSLIIYQHSHGSHSHPYRYFFLCESGTIFFRVTERRPSVNSTSHTSVSSEIVHSLVNERWPQPTMIIGYVSFIFFVSLNNQFTTFSIHRYFFLTETCQCKF